MLHVKVEAKPKEVEARQVAQRVLDSIEAFGYHRNTDEGLTLSVHARTCSG